MAKVGNHIEAWKVDLVRNYLARHFPDARIDDFPRGSGLGHLFQVMRRDPGGYHRVAHQTLIMNTYFERYGDAVSLRQELTNSSLAEALTKARDRTIELR